MFGVDGLNRTATTLNPVVPQDNVIRIPDNYAAFVLLCAHHSIPFDPDAVVQHRMFRIGSPDDHGNSRSSVLTSRTQSAIDDYVSGNRYILCMRSLFPLRLRSHVNRRPGASPENVVFDAHSTGLGEHPRARLPHTIERRNSKRGSFEILNR